MKRSLLSLSLMFLVAACSNAQKASEVSSIRVPIAPYLNMDCRELATEQNQLVREAELLMKSVDDCHRNGSGWIWRAVVVQLYLRVLVTT